MGVDKFSKPLIVEPTDPVERSNLINFEEVIPDEFTAEEHFSKLLEQLKIAEEVLPKDGKLLEVGTGTGALLEYLQKQGYDIVGVDGRPRHMNNLPVAVARIERLPFANGAFDTVISSGVFDKDMYRQYMRPMRAEILRVLKPEGLYISLADYSNKNVPHMYRLLEPNDTGISLFRKRPIRRRSPGGTQQKTD